MKTHLSLHLFCVLALALAGIAGARAQDAESIRLSAKPPAIFADGVASTTITAEVRDRSGGLAPDNQVVSFSTTLGVIEAAQPTRGGQVSVRLTSSTVPGTATVTASSGHATAEVKVTFSSKPITSDDTSHAIVVRAKYLLYNDLEGVLDAAENVRIRIGGVTITADRAQLDFAREVVRAQSQTGANLLIVSNGKSRFAADKVRYDWATRTGYAFGLTEPVRGLFNFTGGALELAKATGVAPENTFDLADLAPSPLSIKASRVVLIPGNEIQFTHAQIMLNGKRRISLPYHVQSLRGSRVGDPQYVGLGSRGPLIDLPYYVAAGEVGTSQLRLKYNAPEGLYGATIAGWALDLLGKYSLGTTTDGSVELTRITSPDWGFTWAHNQQFNATTRGYFNLDTRSFGQRYSVGSLSLTHQAKEYNLSLSGYGTVAGSSTGTVLGSIGSAAHPLFGGLFWTVGASAARYWQKTTFANPDDATQTVTQAKTTDSLGVDARVSLPTLRLPGALTINASAGPGLSWSGGNSTRTVLGTVSASHPLGRHGAVSANYNYNDFTSSLNNDETVVTDAEGHQTVLRLYTPERQTLTTTITYGRTPRWFMAAFATLGLEQKAQNLRLSGNYVLSPLWTATFSAGVFRQRAYVLDYSGSTAPVARLNVFQATNYELRLTRQLGERALSVVFDSYRRRIYLDYLPGRNF